MGKSINFETQQLAAHLEKEMRKAVKDIPGEGTREQAREELAVARTRGEAEMAVCSKLWRVLARINHVR